jgi:hypothetical protein
MACLRFPVRLLSAQSALQRPEVTFKVYQFPADKIPRIDGNADDWAMVPDSYTIGMDQLMDSGSGHLKQRPTGRQNGLCMPRIVLHSGT